MSARKNRKPAYRLEMADYSRRMKEAESSSGNYRPKGKPLLPSPKPEPKLDLTEEEELRMRQERLKQLQAEWEAKKERSSK